MTPAPSAHPDHSTAKNPSNIRRDLVRAIHQILGRACARDSGGVVDSMVYGKRFSRPEIAGIDWCASGATCGFTLQVCSHACDLAVTLRLGDLRIGVFLPSALLADLGKPNSGEALQVLLGDQQSSGTPNALLARGFDAWPPSMAHLMLKHHEHGAYLEFCFNGSMLRASDAALYGERPVTLAADAIAHACIHLLQSIGAHVHRSQVQERSARGQVERIEFKHQRCAADLVRNYGLDPAQIEVIADAQGGQIGEYALLFRVSERESVALFLDEVVQRKEE